MPTKKANPSLYAPYFIMGDVTLVIGLLINIGPFAIIGRVIPVCIFTIKSMFRGGFLSHIRKKIVKSATIGAHVEPTLAYLDTPPAIVGIIQGIGVVTAAAHCRPSDIFGLKALRDTFSRHGFQLQRYNS